MAEHGNWPIFAKEFEKLDIFLRNVESRNIVGHRHFVFLRTENSKASILRTLILLNG